ncbi:MAG: glycoside hydrolase family 95 protein, partial [Planctomycetota bacterium]
MDSEQPREKIMQKTTYPATRRSIVVTLCLSVLCLAVSGCMSDSAARSRIDDENWADMLLWYRQPATEWTEALPVGNGRLGAMVFGGAAQERLQFNDDTLWTGQPHEYHHAGAVEYLPTVRNLLFEGKQRQADRLAAEHMMSVPLRQEKYQPFGDLHVDFPGHDEYSDYRRQLDIDSGLSTVRYRVGEATFTREVFSSFPDQVIVVRLSCDRPGQMTFTAKLDSPHPGTETLVVDEALTLRGQLREYMDKRSNSKKPSVLKFEARLGWRAASGQAEATAGGVDVKGADSVTLILAAATSFRNFQDVSGDPA